MRNAAAVNQSKTHYGAKLMHCICMRHELSPSAMSRICLNNLWNFRMIRAD